MKKNNIIALYLVSVLSLFSLNTFAQIVLPAVFTDNMVLQQKENVALWGKSSVNREVFVQPSWSSKKYITQADSKGNWKLVIKTPSFGGPYTITFNDGEIKTLKNVMIGEVWICSGQSNMEMSLAGVNNNKKEIASANYPNIRLLQSEKVTSTKPLQEAKIKSDGWEVCSPETVAGFSAVAYFFARDIYQKHQIPIGLIHTSWGGTVAEAWTSASSLKKIPDFVQAVDEVAKSSANETELLAKFNEQMQKWTALTKEKDAGYNSNPGWSSPAYNSSTWKKMNLPSTWEDTGLAALDGSVWFRKKLNIPKDWLGNGLTLNLGTIDDDDITWFNGSEIGTTTGYNKKRVYSIPASLVKEGENEVVIRVWDSGNEGGIYGDPKELFISNNLGKSIPITGLWSYREGVNIKNLPATPQRLIGPNRPTVLYNAMINPFINYTIRGAIWYQGESNASRAHQYQTLFPTMINDWREKFANGDFPFYYVQLANFKAKKKEPGESDWAELREAQLKTLKMPNTGMAVIIDVGEEKDIHPKNKQDVGHRLALIARSKLYKEKVVFSGPAYKSHKIKKDKIILSFKHTGSGLVFKNSENSGGFSIAGADQKFYWATAKIVKNKVIVRSPNVSDPLAVRYAWADNPSAILYNKEGLPASPFRTDDWKGITN
jgi:sialate O-acetylesterase